MTSQRVLYLIFTSSQQFKTLQSWITDTNSPKSNSKDTRVTHIVPASSSTIPKSLTRSTWLRSPASSLGVPHVRTTKLLSCPQKSQMVKFYPQILQHSILNRVILWFNTTFDHVLTAFCTTPSMFGKLSMHARGKCRGLSKEHVILVH